MGAIANAIVAYAQPLLDQTNGAVDQMNRAMMLGQMCWNVPRNARTCRAKVQAGRCRVFTDGGPPGGEAE